MHAIFFPSSSLGKPPRQTWSMFTRKVDEYPHGGDVEHGPEAEEESPNTRQPCTTFWVGDLLQGHQNLQWHLPLVNNFESTANMYKTATIEGGID